MEEQLATEPTAEVQQPSPAPHPHAETWTGNERMRHIPPIAWIVEKLDRDVRQRLEILSGALEPLPGADPHYAMIEQALRSVCSALDAVAEAARHSRPSTPPADFISRVSWSLNNAVSSLRAVDPNTFGRRYPLQTFERSKAETVYAALLVLLDGVERVVPLVREVDPNVDERLLQGLVNLERPLSKQPMA